MDDIFSKLDSPDKKSGEGFIPSDLPNLPPEQMKLVQYILRHSGIAYAKLAQAMAQLPPQEAVEISQLDALLAELVAGGHIIRDEQAGEVSYRAQIRRKAHNRTMKGIWDALDADPTTGLSPETTINSELSKTRSELANRILINLETTKPDDRSVSPQTGETRKKGDSLMADLISTGKSSMEKRAAQSAQKAAEGEVSRKAELEAAMEDLKAASAKKPTARAQSQESINLMGDLVAAGKRNTAILRKTPKEETGFLNKLLRLLGLKSKMG